MLFSKFIQKPFIIFLFLACIVLSCSEKTDNTNLLLLALLYTERTQPTISCYYTSSQNEEFCLQNPDTASSLGSICRFQPLLKDGARVVTNSSDSCEALGYPNCVVTSNYEKCSR